MEGTSREETTNDEKQLSEEAQSAPTPSTCFDATPHDPSAEPSPSSTWSDASPPSSSHPADTAATAALTDGGGAPRQIAPSVDFVAGGLVAAVSKIAVYPMETRVFLIAVGDSATVDARRLWHGVTLKGLENFLYNGLLWVLKEMVRPQPRDSAKPDQRPPATFLGAFAASCAAIILAHPLSNVVVGMQASLRNPRDRPVSALRAARAIVEADGLGGFFRGWRLSIGMRVGSATTLVVYEFMRARLATLLGDDLANFVAGLLGRLSEVCTVQPLKTLRSRQQLGQVLLPSWSAASLLRLWDGVGTAALADAVKIGIRFLLIERLRILLQCVLVRLQGRRKRKVLLEAEAEDAKAPEVCPERAMGA